MKPDKSLIAYCGLYCGACSFKVAFDTNDRKHLATLPDQMAACAAGATAPLEPCAGCKRGGGCDCGIKPCAQSRKLSHCGLCADFPCARITAFNNDGIPHHGAVLENLTALKEMGEENWLAAQEKRWHCACGARLSWYTAECPKCGTKVSGT
jgi:hypothetical protein